MLENIQTNDYRALFERLWKAEHHRDLGPRLQRIEQCTFLLNHACGPLQLHDLPPRKSILLDAADEAIQRGGLVSTISPTSWPEYTYTLDEEADIKDTLSLPAPGVHLLFQSLFGPSQEEKRAAMREHGFDDPFDCFCSFISLTLVSKLDGRVVSLTDGPVRVFRADMWGVDLRVTTESAKTGITGCSIEFFVGVDRLFVRLNLEGEISTSEVSPSWLVHSEDRKSYLEVLNWLL